MPFARGFTCIDIFFPPSPFLSIVLLPPTPRLLLLLAVLSHSVLSQVYFLISRSFFFLSWTPYIDISLPSAYLFLDLTSLTCSSSSTLLVPSLDWYISFFVTLQIADPCFTAQASSVSALHSYFFSFSSHLIPVMLRRICFFSSFFHLTNSCIDVFHLFFFFFRAS